MSKFAIGTQADHVADGRSAPAIAVLPASDESSGYAVGTDGYGARSPFTGARLAFTPARWGAA